jgi:hypothetical protein
MAILIPDGNSFNVYWSGMGCIRSSILIFTLIRAGMDYRNGIKKAIEIRLYSVVDRMN